MRQILALGGYSVNIEEMAAFYYFKNLPSEKLPNLAFDILISGVESESLFILASETDKYMSNLGPIFDKCLEELGLDALTKEQHSLTAIRYYAKKLFLNEIDTLEFGYQAGCICGHFIKKTIDDSDKVRIHYESVPPIIEQISNYTQAYHDSYDDYQKFEDWEGYKFKCIQNINNLAKEVLSDTVIREV
ncbi:MAG: hypothetical protein HWE24_17885 [Oceanospirillaceae bacterium]|nr:hypothetical protein [Oceanospirillaceae bacterium]